MSEEPAGSVAFGSFLVGAVLSPTADDRSSSVPQRERAGEPRRRPLTVRCGSGHCQGMRRSCRNGSIVSLTRTLVAAAIGAGVLYLVGAVALGSPPGATDSPGQVAAWFRDHHDAARLYAWTAALGTFAFAIAAGIIRGALPAPYRDVFLLGAAAFIAETAVQAWLWAALALHPSSLQPATARVGLDIASFWGPILTGATTTMIGAVTALGVRSRPLIPRWLTALGVIAFAEQAVETITVFGTHGLIAPGGDMNVLLGAGLTAIWLAGLVVWTAARLVQQVATA